MVQIMQFSIGIFVANSAGNDGNNPSHNTLGAPADGDSVMAIGSVNSSGVQDQVLAVLVLRSTEE